jgi:GTP-binding protein of the ras superfamily involved in termination of M-phase
MDVEMAEHDDSMNNTTITQSTLQQHAPQAPLQQPPQPVYQPQPPYQQPPYHHQQQPYQPQYDANNGYAAAGAVQDPMHYGASNNPPAQHGFPRPTTAHSDTPFSRSAGYQPYSDQDSTPPYRRGGVTQQQQQQPAPQKMPSRPPSGMSGSVQYGQQPQDQSPGKNPSVVIKVGMVGDAQIGKTSLMVKYVVSWPSTRIV